MDKTPESKYRNFVPWNRKWNTFRRHFPIVLKPTLAGLLMTLIWRFGLYNHHITFSKEAENPILFMIVPLVSFIYVIFASIAVGAVFEEYKTVSRCVVKLDVETFLLHRDEQLPIMMHILVAAPSFILVVVAMLFNYTDPHIGFVAIFSVVFMVVLTWVIATEIDDFERSIWFKEKIPQEWYEIDPEEYFKKNNKSS